MLNIKNLIKGYMLVKQFPQENSLNFKDATLLETIKRNGKRIKVYHLDLGSKTPFRFAAAGTKGIGYFILVDNNYMKLPQQLQEAAISHEIGHIVNGDFDGALKKSLKISESIGANCETVEEAYSHYIQLLLRMRDIIQEFKADQYAIESTSMGAVLGLLEYFSYTVVGGPEVDLRYKHITGGSIQKDNAVAETLEKLIKSSNAVKVNELN